MSFPAELFYLIFFNFRPKNPLFYKNRVLSECALFSTTSDAGANATSDLRRGSYTEYGADIWTRNISFFKGVPPGVMTVGDSF